MIDIVFNLLIFFLLTAVAVPKGMTVDLPEAKTAAPQQESEAVISLTKDNRIYFNDAEIDLGDLKTALARLKPETKIVVHGDKAISYGLFVKVMDLIREQGSHQIILSAEEEKTSESSP